MVAKFERGQSIWLASRAGLVDEEMELAWAQKFISNRPDLAWVLGRYAGTVPNNNKQYLTVDDLAIGHATIKHVPMNLLHSPRDIVGTFVAADMIYPEEVAEDQPEYAFCEALGAMWKNYFPEIHQELKRFHDEGVLAFSMEAKPETITCFGGQGCGETFPYQGPQSPEYCGHLNDRASIRKLNNPLFTGGALIFPPARPGWTPANVKELSNLVEKHVMEHEAAVNNLSEEISEDEELEQMMALVLKQAGDEASRHPEKMKKKKKKRGKDKK